MTAVGSTESNAGSIAITGVEATSDIIHRFNFTVLKNESFSLKYCLEYI